MTEERQSNLFKKVTVSVRCFLLLVSSLFLLLLSLSSVVVVVVVVVTRTSCESVAKELARPHIQIGMQ